MERAAKKGKDKKKKEKKEKKGKGKSSKNPEPMQRSSSVGNLNNSQNFNSPEPNNQFFVQPGLPKFHGDFDPPARATNQNAYNLFSNQGQTDQSTGVRYQNWQYMEGNRPPNLPVAAGPLPTSRQNSRLNSVVSTPVANPLRPETDSAAGIPGYYNLQAKPGDSVSTVVQNASNQEIGKFRIEFECMYFSIINLV